VTLDGVALTVADVSLVVGTAPRVIGIIAMVIGMVPRVVETFGRVMEMAGFSLAARRWQTLFGRQKHANTLQIQAICGITLDFML
jgi:hypothetical protein